MKETGTAIGGYAPDFELPDTQGNVHHLTRYLETRQVVIVVFLGNACPHSRAYLDRLKQLQADYRERGVAVMAINANDPDRSEADRFENMKAFARETQLNFPYLRDVTQDVAESFGVRATPEAFAIDRSGIVRYRGQIDDNTEQPDNPYLRTAIDRMLDGRPIEPSATVAVGCPILWRSRSS